jgi:bifunctional enzyme CysN/CysC
MLVGHLESVVIEDDLASKPFRMPVQSVNHPNLDIRGVTGTIVSDGSGDPCACHQAARSGSHDSSGSHGGGHGRRRQSVTLVLADGIDVSRGVLADRPRPVSRIN